MEFRFEADQHDQLQAIESVVDLFDGQPLAMAELEFDETRAFPVVANKLDLFEDELLRNLHLVQERQELDQDEELEIIEESVETAVGQVQWRFPNFSVEMETGTGKTYVYLRTALELRRRYGLRKFIIVVPSIAIREGVMKTLAITRQHFAELYENLPYRYYTYDADRLNVVRQFALSDSVEFMVMTIDSFNRTTNLIGRETDRLQGEKPISFIQEARPVLILDEPQNMESELAVRALSTLTPLMALRYSATHRNPYNLVFRLTPIEAYRQGLVKQVEVAGVEREADANQPFLRLVSITPRRRSVSAKLTAHVLRAGGGVRERSITVKNGTSLEEKTARPEYAGYVVDEINPGTQLVRFTNNVEIELGETRGADRETVFQSQIRYTIREHFLKQARLRSLGIKVLSLFFIDRVANYADEDGVIRRLFREAFDELKQEFPDWAHLGADDVQAAYFAKKTRASGDTELLESRTGSTDDDRAAYDLIMRDKERLLSFEEPVAFVFSHSALREGWDNPNVFQICTLNQSVSEVRKRQEIGRGVRLAVDQSGARVHDPKVNVLTVVANESYERYVERYQAEIDEDYGRLGQAPRIRNARKRAVALRRDDQLGTPEFTKLWAKIREKTRYSVHVDSEALLDAVVPLIDELDVKPIRIRVGKGRLIVENDELVAQTVAGDRTVVSLDADGTAPELVETMIHLLEQANPPVRLTRRTLFEVFRRSTKKDAALKNPHEWAATAVRLIRDHLADQLVNGIQYEKVGKWYELSQLDESIEGWEDRLVPAQRSLYDHVLYDSDVEKRFVEKLDADDRTKVYLKLPSWFKVTTPVGAYNPDWAIVREERDEHGEPLEVVYLVAETKATLLLAKLRPDERRKITCGERHFEEALGTEFRVVTSLRDLDLD